MKASSVRYNIPMAVSRRKISEKHIPELLRIAKEDLDGLSARLLTHCAELTVLGRTISREALGRLAWDKPPTSGTVGTAVKKLKDDLDEYYERIEGGDEPYRFYVEDGTHLVLAEQRRSFPPTDGPDRKRAIPLWAFARMVRSMCASGPLSPRQLNRKARLWKASGTFNVSLRSQHEFDDLMTWFEGNESLPLSLEELRRLASELGIHPLLLDPLLAKEYRGDCLVLDLKKFLRMETDAPSHGEKAHYAVQPARYPDTSANIVYLKLDAGGHTDFHHHPGTELMMPVEGTVEIRFHDSGLRVLLNPGEVIHFYAEQAHSAWNPSEDSRALVCVLRSYPIDYGSGPQGLPTRQRMRQELYDAIQKDTPLTSPTKGWVLQAMADRAVRESREPIPDEVRDQVGLARMIRRLGLPTGVTEADFLHAVGVLGVRVEEGPMQRFESIEQFLHTLESHVLEFPRQLILALAELYREDLYEALLLRFIFPATAGAVVFRPDDPLDSAQSYDFPPNLPSLPDGYSIPRRNLACSDVDILRLTLLSGRGTEINQHPGFEVLIPLEGEAEIQIEPDSLGSKFLVSADDETVAQYPSDTPHRVFNPGESDARLLVIRLYGDRSTSDL